ncbi:hypothetical protein V8324_12210 [Roseovarius sp. D22-M7]
MRSSAGEVVFDASNREINDWRLYQFTTSASSQSLLRHDTNDYSVPVAYGRQDVWVRGSVDQVGICCCGEVIARQRNR